MINKIINFLLFITILILVTACNLTSAPTQPVISTLELPQGQNKIPQSEASVPRVTVEEAKAALDSGEAVIVDVRSAQAYADGHIAGAISILLGEFEGNIENVPLDQDQWIITYCT